MALGALLLFWSIGAADGAPSRCTRETLRVRSVPVTVGYCVVAEHEGTVDVAETYSSPRGSFGQTAPLSFLPGDEPSRVIEDVAIDRLGVAGILHLTLVMRSGSVYIESALLTPGAITIK